MATGILDIKGISRSRRARLPLREAVPRLQVKRDLPLVDIENVTHGRAGEFVVGGIRTHTAVLEIYSVAYLRRRDVHQPATVDHYCPGESRWRYSRGDHRSIRYCTQLRQLAGN